MTIERVIRPQTIETYVENLEYLARELDLDFKVISDYSGRAMYGATCIAIIANGETLFTDRLRDELTYIIGDEPRVDNMGLDYVWYWPSLQTKPNQWGV